MYKLVAVDLDGTLLNSGKQISEENKKAISQALEKGTRIVICSGRIFAGAWAFARELGIKSGPLIGCNGALIKELDTHELLYSKSLDCEACSRVIELCHGEDIYFHAYVDDTLYTEKLGFSSLNYWVKNQKLPESERVDIRLVKNLSHVFSDSSARATKFVVVSRDIEQLARARALAEKIRDVKVMSSDYDNFEVVSHEVDKGNALKFIAERYKLKREEIMAIGDNENDYSMIEYAGLGVAMGNAMPSVKQIAGHVTLTNDMNGVAVAINKFILEL